jgi:hypothetical protein
MNKHIVPVLAKSPSSSDSSSAAETWDCPLCAEYHTPNAVTIAAHKEAQDIMNGKKKTKTYHSAEEFLADLKA